MNQLTPLQKIIEKAIGVVILIFMAVLFISKI